VIRRFGLSVERKHDNHLATIRACALTLLHSLIALTATSALESVIADSPPREFNRPLARLCSPANLSFFSFHGRFHPRASQARPRIAIAWAVPGHPTCTMIMA